MIIDYILIYVCDGVHLTYKKNRCNEFIKLLQWIISSNSVPNYLTWIFI